ncbi:NAD(P)/FAD-dependent oxidoreductase [Spiroplasma endosymbiont of Aspidapion aeneum]|uniref:NAD(P)/FAD-dependent oxidoreductase n=1 Tax=Spiroplasma endosymbiont of Aspidapion aeneum TaxID=3066276 RepID=UPI00313B7E73
MKNHINSTIYDAIIVGGGPAGTSASLYLKRAGLKILIIEKQALGGKVNFTDSVENYLLGKSVRGMELGDMIKSQITELNIECKFSTVVSLKKNENLFTIGLNDNELINSRSVIIATGTKERLLNVENSDRYQYRGITYCAICDGPSFKNKTMAVIGGGDAAIEESLFLSKIAKKLYLIHRRQIFRANFNSVECLKKQENVEFILDSVVDRVDGDKKIESITIRNLVNKKYNKIDVDVVFPYIGQIPSSCLLKNLGVLNDSGFVIIDENFQTKIKGLYAIGDVVNKKIRQIATAVNDGCVCALNAIKYLQNF